MERRRTSCNYIIAVGWNVKYVCMSINANSSERWALPKLFGRMPAPAPITPCASWRRSSWQYIQYCNIRSDKNYFTISMPCVWGHRKHALNSIAFPIPSVFQVSFVVPPSFCSHALWTGWFIFSALTRQAGLNVRRSTLLVVRNIVKHFHETLCGIQLSFIYFC